MRTAEEIASLMLTAGESGVAIQRKQTRFRKEIAEFWRISEGFRVLEIGCGQGDMTAVLADMVGPSGRVIAVDSAQPDYGAPFTLKESSEHLVNGPLGGRIEFHFESDLFDPGVPFGRDEFDVVVLSHCSWYFSSPDQLASTLSRVKAWSERLCISEWQPVPAEIGQMAHFFAVLIQAQARSVGVTAELNVRTLLSQEQLESIAEIAGWTVVESKIIDSSDLDDGRWEVQNALRYLSELKDVGPISSTFERLMASELDILQTLASGSVIHSLPSFAYSFQRES